MLLLALDGAKASIFDPVSADASLCPNLYSLRQRSDVFSQIIFLT